MSDNSYCLSHYFLYYYSLQPLIRSAQSGLILFKNTVDQDQLASHAQIQEFLSGGGGGRKGVQVSLTKKAQTLFF